jgi:hypothetical protein
MGIGLAPCDPALHIQPQARDKTYNEARPPQNIWLIVKASRRIKPPTQLTPSVQGMHRSHRRTAHPTPLKGWGVRVCTATCAHLFCSGVRCAD